MKWKNEGVKEKKERTVEQGRRGEVWSTSEGQQQRRKMEEKRW